MCSHIIYQNQIEYRIKSFPLCGTGKGVNFNTEAGKFDKTVFRQIAKETLK